jgi:hypothetical protein
MNLKYFKPIKSFLNENKSDKKRVKYIKSIDDFNDEEMGDKEKFDTQQQIGSRAADLHNITTDTTNTPK